MWLVFVITATERYSQYYGDMLCTTLLKQLGYPYHEKFNLLLTLSDLYKDIRPHIL